MRAWPSSPPPPRTTPCWRGSTTPSRSAGPTTSYWCDGSAEEHERCARRWCEAGTFDPAVTRRAPTSARSDPGDVARVEDRTFICSASKDDAGPTNNWVRPGGDARRRCTACSPAACAAARCTSCRSRMGPLGSPIAHIGVELTDSPYVGCQHAHHDPHGPGRARRARADGDFVPACTRSARRWSPARRTAVALQRRQKYIVHFPETREIWSYGSGYGGNALLGKKCFALRIASRHGPRRRLAGRAHADPRA